jgi:dienelactone hydrolase
MAGNEIRIPLEGVNLEGELIVPEGAGGLVLFAHGSGSSRHSSRNQYVASVLRQAGMGTLLFDLLSAQEELAEARTRHLRFNIPLLTERLLGATQWVLDQPELRRLKMAYFGSSTGAAAALAAAADLSGRISAVVSRGGRPDLAAEALERVKAATLLIVGGHDAPVIEINEEAFARLRCEKKLKIVQGASHLFEEPGTLEQVAALAAEWFASHWG